ncbi:hypothetical protein Glove_30g49 [Diversispora epigaea]|uniref:Uncharacterized protein n=1 Tax=Diversispora epigaea TaxID=1348612 RepID=A0A397JP75_9GLOM|nr:hypothetical protein Glove_30g49 [Diversispora epigaea]
MPSLQQYCLEGEVKSFLYLWLSRRYFGNTKLRVRMVQKIDKKNKTFCCLKYITTPIIAIAVNSDYCDYCTCYCF